MNIDLYLVSVNEEYANKNMCKGHWNYKWKGRKGSFSNKKNHVKAREEKFGGLIQTRKGKIYKVDHEGFEIIKKLYGDYSLSQILEEMKINKSELEEFMRKLEKLDIFYYA